MKRPYSFKTDTKLRINSWGEKIAGLTGRSPSTVLGKKYYEVIPRIYVNKADALSLALKKGKSLTFKEYRFSCPIGQFRTNIKINPVKSTNGQVSGVKVAISPNAVCTVAKKLQSSQRLIDIGKIASTLAHGVRNPLNAIKGAIIYLGEKYSDEQTLVEFTKIVQEEISRLDNFISRFLSTSVAGTGLSETDVNALLKKIEVFTSLQAHANNIKTYYEYRNIPLVMIDSFQLEQAILNIINNALETMRGGGRLSVKTRYSSHSGSDFIIIEISDTGPGMAVSRTDDYALPSEEKGKGFGLFITREILQYFGGYLEIKSKKDIGTTVKLCLPVNRQKKGE